MPQPANGKANMVHDAQADLRATPALQPWRDRIIGLERIPAHRLMDHAANWRLHPSAQQAAVAGVLEEIGQVGALLVYQSVRQGGLCVIDGHLRKSLDPAAAWPCLVLDVSDAEADLLLATYDPIAAMASRDERALAALLGSVQTESAALAVMLRDLAADIGGPVAGDGGGDGGTPRAGAQGGGANDTLKVAAIREHYGVEPGQLWQCGVHRVLCGDATRPEDYVKILAGAEVQAVVTDPPYGVGIPYEGFADTLENVQGLVGAFMPLLEGYPVVALTPGIPAMWYYPRPAWLMAWVHPASTSSGPWGFNGLNPILVYGKDPYLQAGYGRRHDHVVLVDDRDGEMVHPCPKPLKMWSWLVERMTAEPAQTILDPFLGSGTSMIAAEQTNRRCFGIELDPGYVAVALDRWERATGLPPKLLNP